jgi:hypothetical protein
MHGSSFSLALLRWIGLSQMASGSTLLLIGVLAALVAVVATPFLRGNPRLAQLCYHFPLAAVLFFSMIRAISSELLVNTHTRPLLLALVGTSLIVAALSGNLRKPAYIPLIALLSIVAICFRETDRDNLALQSALTIVLPVVLVVSLVVIDLSRLVVCLQWLGATLVPTTFFLGDQIHGRLSLIGENPIWLGRMACLGCLGAVLNSRGSKVFRIAVILSMISILWLTQSRGPLLALAVALFSYLALTLSGALRALSILAASAAITTTVLFGYSLDVTTRSDGDVSVQLRWHIWNESLNLIAKAPWLGVGRPVDDPSVGLPTYPHNFLLEVAIQGGVIAVLVVLALLIRAWKRAQLPAMRCLLIAVVVFSFVSGSIWSSYELWLVVGSFAAWPLIVSGARLPLTVRIAPRYERAKDELPKVAPEPGAAVSTSRHIGTLGWRAKA